MPGEQSRPRNARAVHNAPLGAAPRPAVRLSRGSGAGGVSAPPTQGETPRPARTKGTSRRLDPHQRHQLAGPGTAGAGLPDTEARTTAQTADPDRAPPSRAR